MSKQHPSLNHSPILRKVFGAACLAALLALANGCQSVQMAGAPAAASAVRMQGRVLGGQQPVAQATIRLMAVGTSGDGSAAASTMTSAVTTDSNGNFVLTGTYTCTPATEQVYLLATGGNPGMTSGTNNTALALMAALGPCNGLSSSTYITLNEITTVGSVAALLPYMTGATNVGSGSSDASALATAMSTVNQYVNTQTGSAPGPSLPGGDTASTAALTSLADAIAACVNSAGGTAGDLSLCGNLFSYATSNSGANPTDTIAALVNILSNPTSNAANIFNLIPASPAFASGLSQSPSNWSLPIVPSGAGTVQLASATYGVAESAGTVSLSVTRSSSTGTASVDYTTVSGTALAGQDYTTTTGTISWASGDSSAKTITVPLYNPGYSSGTRALTVALNTPNGVTLGSTPSAQVTITENDTALTVGTSASGGTQYLSYSAPLSGSGGVGSLTWTQTGGSLPTGMSLSASGVLSGTPTTSGSFQVTVQVKDSATPVPQTVTQTVTLPITSLASAVAALPSGTSAQAIKNAVLNWGIAGAVDLAAEGNTAAALALNEDVANNLATTFTVPSTMPAAYFPTIPSVATNPMVTAANSSIASTLNSDMTSPPVWDNATLSAGTAGTYLETAQNMFSALLTPGQSQYLNPSLIPSILTRLESAAYYINASDPADIDNDCELPYLYLMISNAWPQLLLPSRASAWKSIIATNTTAELNGYQTYFDDLASNSTYDISNWWINSDVRHFIAIDFGGLVAGNAGSYATIVKGGLAEMQQVLMPDGGTNYTDTQNEAYTYHDIYVSQLARYSQVTGDPTGNTLAAGTRYYTPLSILPPMVGEDVTAPSWKKYWDEVTDNDAMAIVVGLTGDPINQWQVESAGWPASYFDAQYYNSSVTPTALPTNWITYDRNIQGPRGMQGGWAYMGTARSTPYSERGTASFVGAVDLNSTASGAGWTLNAAWESAGNFALTAQGAELVTGTTYGENSNFINEALNQHNASTTTTTFGAVSTTHGLSAYEQAASVWTENELWVLLPDRIIGLDTISNSASQKGYELDGGFKFVSGRATWGTQKTFTTLSSSQWTYGSLTAQVYATDYPNSRTELTNTWEDTADKAGWIILEDANDCISPCSTEYTWPSGTSHYFLAEVRPSTNTAATSVQKLSLATGLLGFTFVDNGTTYTMIANTTANAISYTAPTGSTVTMSGAEYRSTWIDPTGSTIVQGATYAGSIPAYSHIVITQ